MYVMPVLFIRYLCMDEADRMIDMGFEEDVRTIFSFFQVCILLITIINISIKCFLSISL